MFFGPRRRAILGLVTLSAVAAGCGADRFIVIGTAKAPSTSGYVEPDDETLLIHMEHLHPATALAPSLRHYVVWLQSGAAAPLRAGVLKYNPDDRTGELEVTSPYRQLTVKITAETSAEPKVPGDFLVASEALTLPD